MLVAKIRLLQTAELDETAIPVAVRGGLGEFGALAETRVRQHTPQGVGGTQSGLRASVFSETREAPGLFTEVVGSPLAHAEPVELGSKPHFPPVSALIPWVQKFISLEEGETAEGVAFLIARAIARRGTPGHFMFKEGFDEALAELDGIFQRVGLRIETTLVKPKRPGGRA